MSPRASVLIFVAGCSFQRGTGGATGDGPDIDTAVGDALVDTPLQDTMLPADASGLCGGKVWFADFSGDPTTYDRNGDTVNDFRSRGAAFQTSQLMAGEWRVPDASLAPLDMQPFQPFVTRTLVRTRMRGTATNGAHGAVFYINVAIDSNSYAALFADAHLTGTNQQEVNFVNPVAGQGDNDLVTISGFTGAAITIELDIAPLMSSFRYRINGGTMSPPINVTPSSITTTAGFGTLTAYSTAAAFDELYVEVCP